MIIAYLNLLIPCYTVNHSDSKLDSREHNFFVSSQSSKWRGAWSNPCSLATSAASSAHSSRASSTSEGSFPLRVVVLGAAGVGKTSICHQFMTSEHINAYDNSLGENNSIKKKQYASKNYNNLKHPFLYCMVVKLCTYTSTDLILKATKKWQNNNYFVNKSLCFIDRRKIQLPWNKKYSRSLIINNKYFTHLHWTGHLYYENCLNNYK